MIAEKERDETSAWTRALAFLRGANSRRDDASHSFGLVMGEYYSYEQLVDFLRRINAAMPSRSRLVDIGKSVEGRSLIGIQVSKQNETLARAQKQ